MTKLEQCKQKAHTKFTEAEEEVSAKKKKIAGPCMIICSILVTTGHFFAFVSSARSQMESGLRNAGNK